MIGLLRQTSKTIELKMMCFFQLRTKKEWLHRLAMVATHLGGATFAITTTLIYTFLFFDFGQAALILLCSHLLVVILKRACGRVRPYLQFDEIIELRSKQLQDASFPSGHTSAAFTVAMVISHAFPFLTAIVFPLATLVGWTRIYLGVHFPTDVLVGAIIGILVPMAIFSV